MVTTLIFTGMRVELAAMTPRQSGKGLDLDPDRGVWARYAEGTQGREPMKFHGKALERTGWVEGRGRLVIDLGSGAGNEALAFLDDGWRVLAVDSEPRALEILESRVDPGSSAKLETRLGLFHEVELPEADLVFASLSLPFAGTHFEEALASALQAVKPGGWFVGVLFGNNDTWADEPDVTTVDMEGIEAAFSRFVDLEIEEEEFDGSSGSGPKHWHWYVVSAKRPVAN
jgi:tellurite methyltransferase